MGKPGKDELARRLLDLKNDLEESKSKRSELQGELKGLMNQLKEFQLKSVLAAEAKLAELDKQLEKLQSKLNDELKKAEEAFSDDG